MKKHKIREKREKYEITEFTAENWGWRFKKTKQYVYLYMKDKYLNEDEKLRNFLLFDLLRALEKDNYITEDEFEVLTEYMEDKTKARISKKKFEKMLKELEEKRIEAMEAVVMDEYEMSKDDR